MNSVLMLFLLSNPKPKKAKIDRRQLCFINERRLKLCLKIDFTIRTSVKYYKMKGHYRINIIEDNLRQS